MGRALWACLHGDFAAAFAQHPLGPAVFVAATTVAPLRVVAIVSRPCRTALHRALTLANDLHAWPTVLVVTLAVWLARFLGAFGGPAEVNSPLMTLLGAHFG